MKLSLILVLLLILPLKKTLGSDAESQTWTSLQLNKKFNESPWGLGLEGIYRQSTTKNEVTAKALRPSVSYYLANGARLLFFFESREGNSNPNNEIRLGQQISKKFELGDFNLSLRLRQEQRLFNETSAWLHRSRLQGRLDFQSLKFGFVTPFISNEFFYTLNSVESRQAGTLENRLNLGANMKLTTELGLDFSLMDRRVFVKSAESRYEVVSITALFNF